MKLRDSLIQNDSIVLRATALNWQEAVTIGAERLRRAGVVDEQYGPAIIRHTLELGPYYLLAPGLAMPHARPQDGVNKNGFALVTLATPVRFGHEENDPVDILITLAATDAKAHNEEGIRQIADLFEDEANFDRLRSCRQVQGVIDILDSLPGARE
jgi:PTS system ascorbate-specific IIA component